MLTEQRQKLRFLGGEFLRLIIDIERLLLSIEGIFADAEHCHVLVSLPPHAAENGADPRHELLHREGFGDIVIGPELEALKHILLHITRGKEYDWRLAADVAYFLREREAILPGHHHIEHA